MAENESAETRADQLLSDDELAQANGGIIIDQTGQEVRFKCLNCGKVWRESELRPRMLYCACGSDDYTRYYG